MKRLLAVIAMACGVATAQSNLHTDKENPYEIASAVPNTPTAAISRTVILKQIILTNTGSGSANDATCTIKDKDSTPLVLFDDVIYGKGQSKGSHYIFQYPAGRRMANGITWSCTTTTVTGSLVYELRP